MNENYINAVGYFQNLDITKFDSLIDLNIKLPMDLRPQDILVKVKAISVNPVDYKIRKAVPSKNNQPNIVGWDVAGIIEKIGSSVTNFKVGDEVYYAGDITRSGGNAEYHLVDSRLVGFKPKSLNFEQAAALPLTTITAWEIIFDRLNIKKTDSSVSILVMGGAGGVGSIAIQLIKKLTKLKVIATASRSESVDWVKSMGADAVINHGKVMLPQIESLGLPPIKFIISTVASDVYSKQFAEIIEPQGHIALIDDPEIFDIVPFKRKSVSLHWELMFTRSMFQTSDVDQQGKLLNEVSRLVDDGVILSTQKTSFGKMTAQNLKAAHAWVESGKSIGKITLTV